jgi:hypothetical protein
MARQLQHSGSVWSGLQRTQTVDGAGGEFQVDFADSRGSRSL